MPKKIKWQSRFIIIQIFFSTFDDNHSTKHIFLVCTVCIGYKDKINLVFAVWIKAQVIFCYCPSCLRNATCFKRGQKWLENNHPALISQNLSNIILKRAFNFQVSPKSVAPSQPGSRLTKSGHPSTGKRRFSSAEEIRPRRPQPRSFDGSIQRPSRSIRHHTFCRITSIRERRRRRRRQCHRLTSFVKRVLSFAIESSNCLHNNKVQQGSFFTSLPGGKLDRFNLT